MEKPVFKIAKSITEGTFLMVNNKNDLKIVSTAIFVFFLRPFSKYKICICFIYNIN